ncbi:DUF4214 domain-containing protein [Orrella daihaiensis]|uniref:DUF4214 domain-containing protein n=1 Tax=Orrella daihaiensis TaxID=2782176 RepID=A0ABY4AJF0_9BURK|nr:DUF4214 domain-containing protein [Orrella daihaiensis]UOD50415.1 DUF4214 domain-containing protein [Orrella daihaiensis]
MAIVYTQLADPLLNYLSSVEADTSGTSASLSNNLALSADYFNSQPQILTANFGFDGYMGVPGLLGTGTNAQTAAYQYGVSYEAIDPALGAPARAYYSAVGSAAFLATYGVPANLLDTIPVVFSHPVLGTSLNPEDFRIELNTGEFVTPIAASFLPNVEFNERQTVVITGDWGNRLQPSDPDALYPVSVSIVDDGTPLQLITKSGLVSAVGFTVASANPYVQGNGPRILSAKLDAYTDLGEGAPAWLTASTTNSGSDLYGDQAMYRLRIYTSAGFSPDGIASLTPDDYSKFFQMKALDQNGNEIMLLESGVDYTIAGYGTVRILGIADTGPAQDTYNAAYVEDHDNQYDIILSGDAAAIAQLQTIRMPSSGDYSPVYNPGGPGNDPENNPPVPFTVPSSDQTVAITHDFDDGAFVSYVEVDGPVVRNTLTGQPIGADWGLAVDDLSTGHQIHQYIDPDGKIFYASFEVSPIYDIRLTDSNPSTNSRVTDDQIFGSDAINTVTFAGSFDQYVRAGNLQTLSSEDQVPLRDADDNLFDVERLIYTDTGFALDIEGNAGFAYSLYGAFDRAPDVDGLGYWIAKFDQGASLTDVAAGFIDSAEFTADYGSSPTNTSYVEDLYQNFFNRQAETEGLEFWVGLLDAGLLDQADVMAGFSRSAEYQAIIAPDIDSGIQYQMWVG